MDGERVAAMPFGAPAGHPGRPATATGPDSVSGPAALLDVGGGAGTVHTPSAPARSDDEVLGAFPLLMLCPHLIHARKRGVEGGDAVQRGGRLLCEPCADRFDTGNLTAQDFLAEREAYLSEVPF